MKSIFTSQTEALHLGSFLPGLMLRGALLLLLLAAFSLAATGQQTPLYSAYFFNKFLVNPAFAGIDNQYRAFGFYRTQWANVPMRPVTDGATAEASLWNDRVGVGLQAINDQAGIFNETTVALSYAQKILLAKDHQLSIGAEGQMIMNKINFSAINSHDASDPGVADQIPGRTVFDFGLGIAYSYKNTLLAGFSVPNILQPNARYSSTGQQQTSFQYLRNYTSFVQYKLRLLHEKFNITPSLLMRKAEASGYQLDGTVIFDYKNIVFAGGGYRTSFGVVALAGVNILNVVTVAYAYDAATQPLISGQVGPTHEITVGFHLPSDFKVKKKSMRDKDVMPAQDQVFINQSELDSLHKNSDSLTARLNKTQHVLDSLAMLSAGKTRSAKPETVYDKAKATSGLTSDSIAQNISTKRQLKQATNISAISNNTILNADKMAGQDFKLDKISFEYKRYRLLPQSEEQLDTLVNLMKRSPKIHIAIKGYTDNIGSEPYNLRLSAKRAEAVANYLAEKGIDKSRLRAVGLGTQNPAADNDTEEGREANRRVEFTIER